MHFDTMFRLAVTTISSLILLYSSAALAVDDPTPDFDAAVVLLRADCTPASGQIENCFESMETLSNLTDGWLWFTRSPSPSAANPILVDVGPGVFGAFTCDGQDHVTVSGAGRELSILKSDRAGVDIKNCDQMSFIDIGSHGSLYGATWVGTGSGSWSNVDIVGTNDSGSEVVVQGWADQCDFGLPFATMTRSLQYFHGSRIRTTGSGSFVTNAFSSQCAETWFFGGEILMASDSPVGSPVAISLVVVAEMRVFGTAVRASAISAADPPLFQLVGVSINTTSLPSETFPLMGKGMFHSHGAIINTSVDASVASDVDVIGLRVRGDSFAHTPGTTFVLRPGGDGAAIRVELAENAVSLSSFLWQAGPLPPGATTHSSETNNLASQHGADLWVETDCNGTGDCNGAGDETHLMIYNEILCGANPWFDTTTGSCRQ